MSPLNFLNAEMKVGKIKDLGGYGIEVSLQDYENENKNGCHAELRRSISAKANERCTGPRSPFDGAQGDTHFILLWVETQYFASPSHPHFAHPIASALFITFTALIWIL